MNYREKMREYLKEPDEYSSQYGKWGALNREQRQMITRLLNEMDRADEVIKHQFFEIERLNNQLDFIKDQNKYIDKLEKMVKERNSIIKEVREYIEQDIKANYFKRYDDEVYNLCDELLEILRGDKE